MSQSPNLALRYSKFKVFRNILLSAFYLAVAYGIYSLMSSLYRDGTESEINSMVIFIGVVFILCTFFGIYILLKWFPCLFTKGYPFIIRESGLQFKPNIGFWSFPWKVESQLIEWNNIEEYWFLGAKNLGEQSMVHGAYALTFKLKNSDKREMVDLGSMVWNYKQLKETLDVYAKSAVIGGN